MEQDEIYLIDLWRIVVREWRWWLAVAVVILALTVAFTVTARSQWEAEAWIQVGQVGPAPAGLDPKVESFQRVIERIKTEGFQDQVTRSAGFAHDTPEAGLYRKSLKIEPEPYANLIHLRVRGYSTSAARDMATATLARLQVIHAALGASLLRQVHARLQQIDTGLATALADRERLQSGLGGKDPAAAALAGALLASRNDDIRSLEKEKSDLVGRLAPNYTFDTSMAWPVAVPDRRAYPNNTLTVGAGFLLALFLGGLSAVGRDALRRHSTKARQGGTHVPVR